MFLPFHQGGAFIFCSGAFMHLSHASRRAGRTFGTLPALNGNPTISKLTEESLDDAS
jgi:hypothetical protein